MPSFLRSFLFSEAIAYSIDINLQQKLCNSVKKCMIYWDHKSAIYIGIKTTCTLHNKRHCNVLQKNSALEIFFGGKIYVFELHKVQPQLKSMVTEWLSAQPRCEYWEGGMWSSLGPRASWNSEISMCEVIGVWDSTIIKVQRANEQSDPRPTSP